ncbi:AEC family transporter [Rhodobium gokarnense]|uniref:Permease n=1 Tax=Rhodobium gokarnense TaxID=364296 RepID=A0ABT3HE79_9HYPH|nr:AEC family transporter [Rhodobium gokarnense]MCW2308710.1 putative permease [Rhodobium gokarnense]
MTDVALIVLPAFALIGLGYAIAWFNILKTETGEALGDFVFTIAMPVLIFRTLATADFPDISPWPVWISYFSAVAIIWVIADLLIRKGFKRNVHAGVVAGFAAGYSNLVLVGVPITYTAFGEAGTVPLLILISVHLPIMMVVGTILIERANRLEDVGGEKPSRAKLVRTLARNLIVNPLILAILVGIGFRYTGLTLDGLPKALVNQLTATATPCALFALGMALKRYGIGGNVGPALVLSVLKVVVLPIIVFVFAYYLTNLPPLWVTVITIGAACPAGVNTYLMANRFRTGLALASNTITITTAASVVTVTMLLAILGVN